MQHLNRATLIGRVGRDPEIVEFTGGNRVAKFSLATTDTWKDSRSGERREKTEWHRIVVFNENLIGVIERSVKKGSPLFLEGQIETRSWNDKGQEKYITEIVLPKFGGTIRLIDNGDGGRQGEGRSGRGAEETF